MASVDVLNMNGEKVGVYELSDSVFAAKVNEAAVHAAVTQYLANQRQGTRKTLTRAEVRGGGIKPRPQKGTGHSRQGSIRNPQWKGGGHVFALRPQDHGFKLNKKVKRLALKSALTSKFNDGGLIVLDEFKLPEIKTKAFVGVLSKINAGKSLVVIDTNDRNVVLSGRNLPDVSVSQVNEINVYDVLKYKNLVVTREAARLIGEVYA